MRKFRYLTLIILFGLFNNNAVSQESINFIKEITETNDFQLKRWNNKGFQFY